MSPGLRYGYVTNGLTDHRLEDALSMLAECGYDGVALTLDHVHFDPMAPGWRDRATALRERLSELGLDVVVETGARFALDPRRKHFPNLLTEGRERRIELLHRAIDIAAELGSPIVSLWSGVLPDGLDSATAWERLREGCRRVVAHAEEREVTLGFEPEPGMLVERLDHFDHLAHDLGHPRALGLTLDLGHCVCVEPQSVTDCVRRAAPWLVHVHADDMRRGVHEHLMFGDGELDLRAALAALAEIPYGGMVAVELSRHAHRANDVVPAAIALMKAHEREEAAV
jgi:L-ribulose-5-phosphate 3-epimerase